MQRLRIADFVVEHIHATVGSRVPESGGALLGFPAERLVTAFLFDPDARTGAAVYHNSSRLIERIALAEQTTAQRFFGILHSHPAGVARPSSQDRFEFATALEANDDLPAYVSPIVTFDSVTPLAPHELLVGEARMSFFTSTRSTDGVRLEAEAPVVLPIASSLRAVDPNHSPVVTAELEGVPMFLSELDHRGRRLVVSMHGGFPTTAPLVVTEAGSTVSLAWRLDIAPEKRLVTALDEGMPEKSIGSGVHDDLQTEPLGDWQDLQARAGGLLSTSVHDRSVLLVGAGSVGSDIAEGLTRSGVGRLTIIDPDLVEAHNLGRSRFDRADIGLHKAAALARRLQRISDDIELVPITVATDELTREQLGQLIAQSDVVVAATDDPAAQALINQLARHVETPGVFVGLYARAEGGEIIVSRSGVPCFDCATGGIRSLSTPETARPTDYGTGRLVAEPGLVSDIQFVTATATRVILGLVDDEPGSGTHDFVAAVLDNGQSYVALSMRPNYWVFPSAMRDAAAQYAMQSLWMRVEARPDCRVCGIEPENPLLVTEPRLSGLRRRLKKGH